VLASASLLFALGKIEVIIHSLCNCSGYTVVRGLLLGQLECGKPLRYTPMPHAVLSPQAMLDKRA
jgi:hypothetical protein